MDEEEEKEYDIDWSNKTSIQRIMFVIINN